jgi:hypothetical protein
MALGKGANRGARPRIGGRNLTAKVAVVLWGVRNVPLRSPSTQETAPRLSQSRERADQAHSAEGAMRRDNHPAFSRVAHMSQGEPFGNHRLVSTRQVAQPRRKPVFGWIKAATLLLFRVVRDTRCHESPGSLRPCRLVGHWVGIVRSAASRTAASTDVCCPSASGVYAATRSATDGRNAAPGSRSPLPCWSALDTGPLHQKPSPRPGPLFVGPGIQTTGSW